MSGSLSEAKHDPPPLFHRFSIKGMRYINGYDDVEIVAGAGTMGMEILEQVGGGGRGGSTTAVS